MPSHAPLIAALTLAALGWVAFQGVRPAAAQEAAAADRTPAIVAAAEAFLATLTEEQRDAVLFDWTDDAQRTNWSNLPIDMVPRGGLAWGDMVEAQRAALMDLLGTVLSEDGVRMIREQMAADDVLAAEDGGGGLLGGVANLVGLGGPGLTFGSAWYYVSLLGEPDEAKPWTLQFGGHHLAINATVTGPDVTLSPSLTGGQPLRFAVDGEEVWIVEEEVAEATALLASLSDAQREAAVVGATRIDLVLGPGKDGMVLQPEGLPAAEMTEEQQALLLGLVEARLGILNEEDLAAAMAPVAAGLGETHFGWWGPVDDPTQSYWRVTGPALILEFSPQDLGGDPAQHAHNMYRDPTNEYGATSASP